MSLDSGFNLGNAYGRIVISDNVDEAVNRAQQSWTTGIQNIGQTMQNLGANLTLALAPVTAFVAQGVGAFASFDAILSEISARTGATAEEMDAVRLKAMEMGRDTAFSATDAADAMLQLLSSGYDLRETMIALEPVLNLAAAGGLNLGTAADAVTDILAQFRLGAESATDVTDALSAAAGSSSATVGDLIAGFANVGPVASSFGISVDQTAAILGTFSENGIKGAEAGTQLRSMLNNMTRNTDEVQGMWQQLGVSMTDSEGNFRDINDIIQDLNVAMEGMSESERADAIRTLAGSYGQMGLTALLASDGIEDMEAAMAGAASAAEVAEARNSSFRGVVNQLKSSLEILSITVIGPLVERYLSPLIQRVTEVINQVNNWLMANPQLTEQLGLVLGVLSVLGPSVFTLGKAISTVGAILGFVFSPIGILIGLLTALYLAFQNNFLGIRDILQPVIDTISNGISRLMDSIGWFIDDIKTMGIVDAILNAFGFGSDGVEIGDSWIEGVLVSFGMARDTANGIVKEIGSKLSEFITFVEETVVPGLQTLADWFITDGLPAAVDFVNGTVVPAVQGFFDFLAGVWDKVSPALSMIADWFITSALPSIVTLVNDSILPAVKEFFNFLAQAWEILEPGLSSFADWFLVSALPPILDIVNNLIPVIGIVVDVLRTIWEVVSPALLAVLDFFVTTGFPVIQKNIQFVLDVVNLFLQALVSLWADAEPGVNALKDGMAIVFDFIKTNIIDPVVTAINSVVTAATNAAAEVERIIGPVIDEVNRIVSDPIGSIGGSANPFREGSGALRGVGDLLNIGRSRDSGGPGVANLPYLIGPSQQGAEVFVPGDNGTFLPDFADTVAQMVQAAAGGGGGGDIYVTVSPPAGMSAGEAQMLGEHIGTGVRSTLRSRGTDRG
ncbi:MAG: phage tail tape measure protein [Aggregatilineales bacterium]